MSYEPDVQYVLQFDSLPVKDSISGNNVAVVGDDGVTLDAENDGYQMSRQQYLLFLDAELQISSNMTIGFFLKPTSPGRILSSDPYADPLKISLMDFGIGSNYGSDFSMDEQVMVIHEEVEPQNGENRLRIILYSNGNSVYEALTEPYTSNIWHHFWITYDGSGFVSVFIDGIESTLTNTGVIPSSINANLVDLSVNRLAIQDGNCINSNATLSDLVVFNSYKNNQSVIQKWVNDSLDNIIITSKDNSKYIYYGFKYDDPVPNQTLDSYYDGTHVYSSTASGKIQKGSYLIWEVRHDFSDNDEISHLESFGDNASQSGGFLKLSNTTIRL